MEMLLVTSLHHHLPGRSSTALPQEVALLPSQKVWTQLWTHHLCHHQTLGWRVEMEVIAAFPRAVVGERCVGETATGSWSCSRLRQDVWKAGASKWSRRPKTTSFQRRVSLPVVFWVHNILLILKVKLSFKFISVFKLNSTTLHSVWRNGLSDLNPSGVQLTLSVLVPICQ